MTTCPRESAMERSGFAAEDRIFSSSKLSFILMYYILLLHFLSLLRALLNIFLCSVRHTRWYLEAICPLFLVETKSWWRAVAASSSSKVQAKLVEHSYWADRANIITIFTPLDLSLNRWGKQNRSILDYSIYELESNHMTISDSMTYMIHKIICNARIAEKCESSEPQIWRILDSPLL